MMHGPEKSDSPIVASKPTNKAARAAAEPGERRGEAKGNAEKLRMRRTQCRESVSQQLDRVRQTAKGLPPNTQGGSPVREFRPPGSERGVPSNEYPYRDIMNNIISITEIYNSTNGLVEQHSVVPLSRREDTLLSLK